MKKTISRKPVSQRRKVLSYYLLILCIYVLWTAWHSADWETSPRRLRAFSQTNLHQFFSICQTYAADNGGFYPPASRYGYASPDFEALYPDYLVDPCYFINPRLPEEKVTELSSAFESALRAVPPDWETISRLAAQSYTYTGWLITNEQEALLLNQARAQPGVIGDEPIHFEGAELPRLEEGVEMHLLTDDATSAQRDAALAKIPVMFENMTAMKELGVNGVSVYFMDGHVTYVRFGAFPATDAVAAAFEYGE